MYKQSKLAPDSFSYLKSVEFHHRSMLLVSHHGCLNNFSKGSLLLVQNFENKY